LLTIALFFSHEPFAERLTRPLSSRECSPPFSLPRKIVTFASGRGAVSPHVKRPPHSPLLLLWIRYAIRRFFLSRGTQSPPLFSARGCSSFSPPWLFLFFWKEEPFPLDFLLSRPAPSTVDSPLPLRRPPTHSPRSSAPDATPFSPEPQNFPPKETRPFTLLLSSSWKNAAGQTVFFPSFARLYSPPPSEDRPDPPSLS